MTELKPCPFCGNKAILEHSELNYLKGNCADSVRGLYSTEWTVKCSYCSISKVKETEYYRFTNNEELIVSNRTGFNENNSRKSH